MSTTAPIALEIFDETYLDSRGNNRRRRSGIAGLAQATVSSAKLQLRKTSVGTILVDACGFTLYVFTRDGRAKNSCATVSGCRAIWPFVTTGGKPVAGPGVKSSLIGTITLNGKTRQVTYAERPLYTYSGDNVPGEADYINASQFGGHWPALTAAGQAVK